MKALVYTAPSRIEFRSETYPVIDQGESVVKVDAVGICGSDLHAYLGHDSRRVPPLILGHEAYGTVIDGPKTGKNVVVNPLITCGVCEDCLNGQTNLCRDRKLIGMNRPGAFAEYLGIPASNLVEVSDLAKSGHMALTEPAAVSLHAVRLIENVAARPLSEGSALVIGGGAIGLLCVLFLQDYGCKHITLSETNAERRKAIELTETCHVIDPTKTEINPDSYHCVIDAVGNSATRDASVKSVRSGGVILHVGLGSASGGLDLRRMTLAEITFIGSYTYSALDFKVAAKKIENAEIGPLDWIDERPLAEGVGAFRELIDGQVSSPKIILRM